MPQGQKKHIGIALVTGAATRVGRAIARHLAAQGYAIIIHYRASAVDADGLREQIECAEGSAEIVQADLTDRDQRNGLISAAAKHFGPITLLVNNASSYAPDSPETLNQDLWDTHFAIHAEAPLFLSRDFANQLPDGVQGNIINIIDERVQNLSPAYTSYTLSKSVLWTATQTLAQALAPRIRVNAVGPGPTLPEKSEPTATFTQRAQSTLLGHGSAPEHIAEAVAYLAGASSVTGQMIAVDGGQHLEFPARTAPTPAPK